MATGARVHICIYVYIRIYRPYIDGYRIYDRICDLYDRATDLSYPAWLSPLATITVILIVIAIAIVSICHQ